MEETGREGGEKEADGQGAGEPQEASGGKNKRINRKREVEKP